MKGFLLFYSIVIIVVFCLMSSVIADSNIVSLLDSTSTVTVKFTGAVDNTNSITIDSDTYMIDALKIAGLKYNADLSEIDKYQFLTNKTYDIPYGIININTAPAEELVYLDGIALSRANDIIAYRNITKFNNINDIKNVNYIGDVIFDKIKNRITV